jgi:hypothetical protein
MCHRADEDAGQAATTVTLNSPAALCELYDFAATPPPTAPPGSDGNDANAAAAAAAVRRAALMRAAALKCIPFTGLPPALNGLRALHAALPPSVASRLPTRAAPGGRRGAEAGDDDAVAALAARGRPLWRSVYGRHSERLLARLGDAHPALPGVVLAGGYGLVLAADDDDDDGLHHPAEDGPLAGRVQTSLVAVACLRAQRGAGAQLTSHVYGLRNAFGGDWRGAEWLGTDEGGEWVLRSVDRIVECFETGSTAR